MGTSVINDISSILPSQPHEVYNSWRSAHSQGKAAVAAIRLQSWFFAPNRTQGPLGRHSASPRSLIHFLSMALPMMDTSHTWNPMTCVRVWPLGLGACPSSSHVVVREALLLSAEAVRVGPRQTPYILVLVQSWTQVQRKWVLGVADSWKASRKTWHSFLGLCGCPPGSQGASLSGAFCVPGELVRMARHACGCRLLSSPCPCAASTAALCSSSFPGPKEEQAGLQSQAPHTWHSRAAGGTRGSSY